MLVRLTILFMLFGITYTDSSPSSYNYKLLYELDGIEIRQYESVLIAEHPISSNSFSALADYIFGGNLSKEKMPMTSPVITTHLRNKNTMSFILDSTYLDENIPQPNNANIKIKEIPANISAVIQFSGYASPERIDFFYNILIERLDEYQLKFGEAEVHVYDPPYKRDKRRNEIVVKILF